MPEPSEEDQSSGSAALPDPDALPDPAEEPRRHRRALVVVASAVVLVLAVAGVVVGLRLTTNDDDRDGRAALEVIQEKGSVTHEFVVPAGTAARVQAGLHVDVVPDQISVRVGDTIHIRNEDDVAAEVGVFNVAPGVTVTMRFTEPGRLEGYCSVDPDGRFVIDVQA